jgi:hypothetical protein
MDEQEFADLHVGNRVTFLDIEGSSYSSEIKSVEPMDGSSSFFGAISDGAIEYPTVITVGEDGSGYIHLGTPEEIYEIELQNGMGYVYKSRDIHHKLSDESQDDVIIKK